METTSATSILEQGNLPPRPSPPAVSGLVATATQVAPPFLSPDDDLAGFVAYQLDVHSVKGRIWAFDVSIKGPLHQRWVDTDFDSVADPTVQGSVADARGDSHLTPPSRALLVDSTLVENNNISPSPLPDAGGFDYGIGNLLTGVWGLPESTSTTTANLAYIVIPEDFDPRRLEIEIKVVTSAMQRLTTMDFFVPEPTTLCCLAVTLLSLGICRVRRR